VDKLDFLSMLYSVSMFLFMMNKTAAVRTPIALVTLVRMFACVTPPMIDQIV